MLQGTDAIDSVTLISNAASSSSGNGSAGSWTITASAATGANFSATNYTITYVTGMLTVNAKNLAVSGVSGTNKIYDGTTTDAIAGTAAIPDLIAGDAVTLNADSATAAFTDSNVGIGKTVAFPRYTISGADATNYTLAQPANSTADITPDGAIAGFVFNDGNDDGVQGAGEGVMGGEKVNFLDALGTWLASTTTDSSGHYYSPNSGIIGGVMDGGRQQNSGGVLIVQVCTVL